MWPANNKNLQPRFHFELPNSKVFHVHIGGSWSKKKSATIRGPQRWIVTGAGT